MGFSSSHLVSIRKCSKSIINKLSSTYTDDSRQECKSIPYQSTPNLSTRQRKNLQAACVGIELTTTASPLATTAVAYAELKKPCPEHLSLHQHASQSLPHIDHSNKYIMPKIKCGHEQKKPESNSTPVTPTHSAFSDNDRFSLTYSKSSASSNSRSSSSSNEEEAITPFACTSEQWTSAVYRGKYAPDSKSQGNRTIMKMQAESSPVVSVKRYDLLPCSSAVTPAASISYSTTGKGSLDRSPSQGSCISSSSLEKLSSKSIFGKSAFHKKESKAIKKWYIAVERLAIQKRVAAGLHQQTISPKFDDKDSAIARFITSELYSTEKSYYQFLLFIRSNYMEPMQNASQSRNPMVKSTDVHVLFYHLPDLISMSEKLVGKLENHATDDIPGMAVGQILKDMRDDFAVFLKYSIHYQGHIKAIRRASSTGYAIKIDRESKSCRKENNRLGLADYLIAPFQRVPRYELLLKDLLKHTNASFIHDLVEAKNVISGLAATMNLVQENISKSFFSASFYSFHLQSTANLAGFEEISS
ncbi:Dbl homology domain-containing protein [Parasitella parasitica]|nr:Dbl homology domain-containing protein [Parasitella parasitica]